MKTFGRLARPRASVRQFARRLPSPHDLAGHYWTLRAHLTSRFGAAPRARAWRTRLVDPVAGEVPLSGLWSEVPGSRRALILVHGLGGSAESVYLRALASAATSRGVSTLRLNLRGADARGGDLYHAGNWRDVAAAAASEELASYEELLLVGCSLGGHVALSYAAHAHEPRLGAVVAVCPPLDLGLAARDFDRAARVYRAHVLGALKRMFRAALQHHPGGGPFHSVDPARVERIASIIEWDDVVIAPRYGFAGARDYYERVSVSPALPELDRRALLICAEHDPMVSFSSVQASLAACAAREHERRGGPPLVVRRVRRAGHLGFPSELDLGFGAERGLAAQVVHFLLDEGRERRG